MIALNVERKHLTNKQKIALIKTALLIILEDQIKRIVDLIRRDKELLHQGKCAQLVHKFYFQTAHAKSVKNEHQSEINFQSNCQKLKVLEKIFQVKYKGDLRYRVHVFRKHLKLKEKKFEPKEKFFEISNFFNFSSSAIKCKKPKMWISQNLRSKIWISKNVVIQNLGLKILEKPNSKQTKKMS